MPRPGRPTIFRSCCAARRWSPITQAWIRNLEAVGITANIRVVDSAQYQLLMNRFDFQAAPGGLYLLPAAGTGAAQSFRLRDGRYGGIGQLPRGLRSRGGRPRRPDRRGADAGGKGGPDPGPGPGTDERLVRGAGVGTTRVAWIAFWDKFSWPEEAAPLRDYAFPNSIRFQPTWWVDPDKAAALAAAR